MLRIWVMVVCACGTAKSGEPVAPRPDVVPPERAPVAPSPPPADVVEVDARPDTPTGESAKRDAELAAAAAPYFDAFTNVAPQFTRDDKRLVFVSNRDGVPQLYVAELGKPAARVVATTQRMAQIVLDPDGKHVLFSSDTGADENWSLFRVGLDGKDLVELTPNAKLNRDPPRIAEGRPDRIVFSARKLNEPGASLYELSKAAPGEPRVIYTTQDLMGLRGLTADGKFAVIAQSATGKDIRVLRVDLASGQTQPIFADDNLVVNGLVLAPDGKRIFMTTTSGDQQMLLAVEAATGKQVAKRVLEPQISISNIIAPRRGPAIAVTFEVGNHSELHLLDAKTLATRLVVALPRGQGAASGFSADGQRLALSWSTPTSPTDAFVVDVRSGKVTSHAEPRPTLVSTPMTIDERELPAFDGGRVPINAFIPPGQAKHPVFMFFHGGPAQVSQIRWSPTISFLVSLGYVVVEPNIRGSGGYGRAFQDADNVDKRPDSFRDIETVARWVAEQPWADKDRIVMAGGSYGGFLALIALSRWPELFRAGVDMFGPPDQGAFIGTTKGAARASAINEYGDPSKDTELMRAIAADLTKIDDPLFVYAGASDPRVPLAESDKVVKALRARRIPVEYMVAANEGHRWPSRRETMLELHARMVRFLEGAMR